MTTIGAILDEFFSPTSAESLWVMPESDGYTKLVRKWTPVIESVNRAKADLAANCAAWKTSYTSNPSWKPGMTDSPKPGAFRDFVPSPPGTDPDTCKQAFIVYVGSMAVESLIPGVPKIPIETDKLYTCSIGSFNIYTTVDTVDCGAKTATMNFWMYNSMSKRSFGKFANNPAFKLCGMKTQFMWWNWTENVDWSAGAVKTVPKPFSFEWW